MSPDLGTMSDEELIETQKELHLSQRQFMKPLPLWKKIIFSFGFYSWGINNGIIGIFQIIFLLEVVELTPNQVGTIMLVKQIYDAITDPIVGVLSDHTNTRFGRRKPWILTFILPTAVVWILMWTFNEEVLNNHWRVYFYYFAIILVYSTLQTLTTIPYQAMVPDIAPDYNDRTIVVMLGQLLGIIAATTSIFLWSTLIVSFPDENPEEDGTLYNYKKGYVIAALITSVPILVTMLIAIIPIKERVHLRSDGVLFKKSEDNIGKKGVKIFWKMFKGMKDLITFPPFVWVAVINIVGGISQSLVYNNINLWIKYWVAEEKKTNLVLLVAQIGILVGIVVFSLLAKQITKKWSLTWGQVIALLAFIGLYCVQPHQLLLALIFIFIQGFAAGASLVLPPAMLPDVIEMDERRTGTRREALFYSFFLLLEKFAIALTQATSSYALGKSGYINPSEQAASGHIDEQPDSVLLTLRILLWVVPSLLKFVIVPFALTFPIVCKKYGFTEQGLPLDEVQPLVDKAAAPLLSNTNH